MKSLKNAPWISVAGSELEDDIRKKIIEIAAYLLNNRETITRYSLLTGKTGVALFFYYCYELVGKKEYYDTMHDLLNEAVEQINEEGSPYLAFCGGLTGVAWCLDFLHERGALTDHSGSVFGADLQPILAREASFLLAKSDYDYLHGAIGILLYLNERNFDISGQIKDLLGLSVEDDSEIRWLSRHPEAAGVQCFNLSVAHGNLSVLYLLVEVYKRQSSFNLKAKITKLVRFISRCKTSEVGRKSLFPNFVTLPSVATKDESRLAWCYGDLGIGYILMRTAGILQDDTLQKDAVEILLSSTKRTKPEETFVADSCFCHGSIGVAHIFNRVFQETRREEFSNMARFWYRKSLDYAVHEDGAAGYKTWRTDGPIALPSLLDGVAGVGLSFVSAITGIAPDWDKFLLLS